MPRGLMAQWVSFKIQNETGSSKTLDPSEENQGRCLQCAARLARKFQLEWPMAAKRTRQKAVGGKFAPQRHKVFFDFALRGFVTRVRTDRSMWRSDQAKKPEL